MSRLVRLHPGMLSVSEFFTMLSERAFVGDRLTGKEVCERLTRLSPAYAVFVEVGTPADEVVYRPGPETRYDVPEDFPPILAVTLPFLTDTPERLLDELLAAVGTRGEWPLGEHYRFVLDWLRERFHRQVLGGTLGCVVALGAGARPDVSRCPVRSHLPRRTGRGAVHAGASPHADAALHFPGDGRGGAGSVRRRERDRRGSLVAGDHREVRHCG